MFTKCNLCENCDCDYYCRIQSQAKSNQKHSDALENAVEENTKCWRDNCLVAKQTSLQFCGIALHLYPNGAYYLEDTTS